MFLMDYKLQKQQPTAKISFISKSGNKKHPTKYHNQHKHSIT